MLSKIIAEVFMSVMAAFFRENIIYKLLNGIESLTFYL